MIQTTLELRPELPQEQRAVETLTREAFWNQYKPGCDEHYLVHILRDSPAFVPELNIVALLGDQLVGHIMYSHAVIRLDAGGKLPVLSFGPISVLPSMQHQGIGGRLIAHTKALASALGYKAILIYGDPAYYSRHGFVAAERFSIGAANQYRAALQVFELVPGTLRQAAGLFAESADYEIDSQAAEAFDRSFPPKPMEADNAAQRRFHEVLAMHTPR